MEVAVVVDDALAQVDVASLGVAISVKEGGTEDGDVAISLKRELDVLGRVGKALAIPVEVTCSDQYRYEYRDEDECHSYRCRCRCRC